MKGGDSYEVIYVTSKWLHLNENEKVYLGRRLNMINLYNVRMAITEALEKENFQVVENKDGFESLAFFIELVNSTCKKKRKSLQEVSATFNIRYFSKEDSHSEFVQIVDRLNSLFDTTIKVKESYVMVNKLTLEVKDDIPSFKVDISYEQIIAEENIKDQKINEVHFRGGI
ncbi:phage tail terminator family protein [Clostridium sp. Marseille-QA1073]